MPRQIGQTLVLAGSPKRVEQPQKIFEAVRSWQWTSRPMTASYGMPPPRSPAANYSIGPMLEYARGARPRPRGGSVAGVRIAILGAGNLGTTLGIVLAGGVPGIRAGRMRDVVLWTIEPDVAGEMRDRHVNTKYLPGVPLPRALGVSGDL